MPDLSITAASVVAVTTTDIRELFLGATVTAGQAVYVAAATNRVMLADSDSATVEARTPLGVALNGGATGQTVGVMVVGDVTIGATMTAGVMYYMSDTPGGICPVADLGAGEVPCTVGFAISTTVMRVAIRSSGVTL